MPIFEYQCETCDKRFEELTLASRAAAPACPECGDAHVHRVFSTFAAQSKGGGGEFAGGFCETPSAGPCGAGGCGPRGCSMN